MGLKYAYFPGCVAKGSAREVEDAMRSVIEALDIELVEMPGASCCGAGIMNQANHRLQLALNARTFAMAEEAGIPILFHVGTADFVLPKAHALNGMPKVKDFHGGEENFRSISYMAISSGPMQALSLLILDGILDRFPNLMFGVIELGSVWVPGFMRQLDSAFEAFGRHEERLQSLKLKPSEYITRQVRVTPYPTEPTGWVIQEAGSDVFMFSSDYPHVEGGRNPLARFEKSIKSLTEEDKDKFFRRNFESLMRSTLD
jgi:predicted TIM-barrel fold metal-dependent hydrolase